MLFGFAVEPFEIRERHLAGVFLLLFLKISNQHTELGAPVADVVGANDLVAEELQRAYGGVADDGGANVAHVHLFGDVRGGVIHHDGLRRADFFHARSIGGDSGFDVFRKERRVEEDIDKARACDFRFRGDPGEIQMGQSLLGELSRRHAQFFRDSHHAVSLIVAELRSG